MRLAIGKGLMPVLLLLAAARMALAAPTPLGVLGYDRSANQDTPDVCFRLSQTIVRRSDTPLENSIAVDPPIKLSATPRSDRLCLAGFSFSQTYTVTLKAGLAGVSGTLPKDAQFRIQIPDRPPELGFTGPTADILPRAKLAGVPIRSVNLPKIEIAIFRISDHDVLAAGARSPLRGTDLPDFEPAHGERIWRGTIAPQADANRDATTLIPLGNLGAPKPGLYVAAAWPSGTPVEKLDSPLATQYFAISDIGLIVYRSPGNLLVAVRSLATASVAPGVDVALVAANNRELGRVKSDENGLARFDANLLRGVGGDRPAAVMAYGSSGDYTFLALAPQEMAPASNNALIYPDRSAYQPGDRVALTIMLRNAAGAAVPKTSLKADIIRPDGTVFDTEPLADQGAGGYALDFALPKAAPSGAWTVQIRGDGDSALVGTAALSVSSGPQPHLAVQVSSDSAILDPAQAGTVTVQTQYPDDGAAANVPGELRGLIEPAPNPYPAFPGFTFGAADDAAQPVALDTIRLATDAGGKASVPLKLGPPPRSTRPLELRLTARMLDAGGQPIEQQTAVPIATQAFALGVRPTPGPNFAAGQPARFEVIALSPDGARQEKAGLGWEVVREDPAQSWYWDGNRFSLHQTTRDTHVANGAVDIPADAPAVVSTNLPAGRYRIEVFDPAGETMSSVVFRVGWTESASGAGADSVELKPVKPAFAPGEGIDVFVQPPYEADVLLVAADSQIRGAPAQHIPATGGTIHLDTPGDAGPVLNLAATALAPPDASVPDLPRRAFQAIVLPRDQAARRLGVKVALPEKTPPQQELPVQVSVDGAGDEQAFVRVIAVDQPAGGDASQGAEVTSVDPAVPLMTDDVYDRIITASGLRGSTPGRPQPMAEQQATAKSAHVSLYSGIVALDKSGKATVPLILPDFSGNLRVRAVAWSASRYGAAESTVAVHYPLALDLPLPSFLRPEDHADLALSVDNSGGPRGEYHVKLAADGAVGTVADASATFNLAEHEQRAQPIALQSNATGDGQVAISVEGPENIAFTRRFSLPVQASADLFRHAVVTLKPNATLTLEPSLLAGLKADTAVVSLLVGRTAQLDLRALGRELAASTPDSAEAIVYRATPCVTSQPAKSCLDEAIGLLLARQREDGGFARFGGSDSDPWLTAFVTDFLTRTRSAGAALPDAALRASLDYLDLELMRAQDGGPDPHVQAPDATAYAALVLARNGRLTIFGLRSLASRLQADSAGALPLGLAAAAFAALGDKETAAADFAQVLALMPDNLRDDAVLAALMAESGGAAQPSVLAAYEKTVALLTGRRDLTGEEAAWLFRLGAAVTPPNGQFRVKSGSETIARAEPFAIATKPGEALQAIKNASDAPISIMLTISGLPAQAEAKEPGGAEIERTFFDLTGKQVDPASVRQGDTLVVVLNGRAPGARPLVTDTLPAGWVVDAAAIDNAADRYPWLKDLTGATFATGEAGRMVAIPNVSDKHEFKLAYVARAAFRGQFALPGPVIQDMAAPNLYARGAAGRTKVDPAS
jgi:uncharacterized protein YfaS (alpha-2-macroglobulin family)